MRRKTQMSHPDDVSTTISASSLANIRWPDVSTWTTGDDN